jgi:prevent-host-death family protein
MDQVPSRELRNDTAGVIRRVQDGTTLIITVNGRPMAQLMPVTGSRRSWISRQELSRRLLMAQADKGLREDLARLAAETTDDLDDDR